MGVRVGGVGVRVGGVGVGGVGGTRVCYISLE